MTNTWWQKLSNPSRFITDITAAAINGSSVVAELPSYTPWIEQCEEEIMDTLRNRTDRSLDQLEDEEDKDPGQIILEKYCKEDKRLEYRPAIGYAKFLAGSDDIPLNDCFIWINGLSEKRAASWHAFVADYLKQRGNRQGGIFILIGPEMSFLQPRKGLKSLAYGDYANEFDTYVFTMLKSSETRLKPQEKQYLARLVSELTGNNAELSAAVSSNEFSSRFLNDPVAVLKEITGSRFKSNGECFEIQFTDEELKKRIWKAQINTIFPLIEEYRSRFVKKHYERIKELLPIDNPADDEEPYQTPEEVEIGVLRHLAADRQMILPYEEYNELTRVRNARNSLAHLSVIDYDEVEWLLRVLPD